MMTTMVLLIGKYLLGIFAVLFAALGVTAVVSARKAKSATNRANVAETELKVKTLEVENAKKPINELIKELDSELDADKRSK